MLVAESRVVGDARMIDLEKLQKIYEKTGMMPTGYHPDTGNSKLDDGLARVAVAHSYNERKVDFHIVPLPAKEQCSEKSKKAVGKYDECCKSLHDAIAKRFQLPPRRYGHGSVTATRCHWYDFFKPEGSDYQYLIAPNTLTCDGATVSNHLGKVQFMRISNKWEYINLGIEAGVELKDGNWCLYPDVSDDWAHSRVDETTRHFILNSPFRVADGGCTDRIVDAFERFIAICEESPLDDSGDYLAGRLEEYVRHSCGKSD